MKKRQPTMAELMVGAPSSSTGNHDEGLEKAAAQAQVGEVFEGLVKEAKEDLIGTMGWAGRVFGEQVAAGLEPQVTKLASILAEIKEAATMQKNREMPEEYAAGGSAGANPGGLPAKLKAPAKSNDGNVRRTATPVNEESPGSKGWGDMTAKREQLQQADKIQEVVKASAVLTHLRQSEPTTTKTGTTGDTKQASLAEIGRQFGAALRADLAQNR